MDRSLPTIGRLLRSAAAKSQAGLLTRARRVVLGALLILAIAPLELINRLALWLDEILFPAYRRVDVCRPLFIVGPPRSGTTLLHRLIAEDRWQFTTFPLWELLFAPAICQKYFWLGVYRLDRLVGGPLRRSVKFLERLLSGGLEGVHPTSLEQAEEDHLLLNTDGACFLWVIAFPNCQAIWDLGRFDQVIDASQRRRVLARYRTLIQRHLYVRGSEKTYLAKNPGFSGWIRSLTEEFSDARFIGLIREPEKTLPSQLNSVRDAMATFGYDVREPEYVGRFVDLFAWYYTHVIECLTDLPTEQSRLLEYSELVGEPAATVPRVLRQLGYQVTNEYAEALRLAVDEARQFRSGNRYTLAEFGLSAAELHARLSIPQGWFDAHSEPDTESSPQEDASREHHTSGAGQTS